jgi:hypothetical protein
MLAITDRDREDVPRLERAIRENPDKVAKIACFNHAEARWIRARLEERGVPSDRFFTTWLTWPGARD